MEHTEFSETSAYKIQTPGNYPEKKHTTQEILSERSIFWIYVLVALPFMEPKFLINHSSYFFPSRSI